MPSINNKGVKELRRTQAEERQAKYDALTLDGKLQQIAERPGESLRETKRLQDRWMAWVETTAETMPDPIVTTGKRTGRRKHPSDG